MTAMLERALEAAKCLPDEEQNRIAAIVLERIEDAIWERSFSAVPERAPQFGDVPEAEHHRGETQILDPKKI